MTSIFSASFSTVFSRSIWTMCCTKLLAIFLFFAFQPEDHWLLWHVHHLTCVVRVRWNLIASLHIYDRRRTSSFVTWSLHWELFTNHTCSREKLKDYSSIIWSNFEIMIRLSIPGVWTTWKLKTKTSTCYIRLLLTHRTDNNFRVGICFWWHSDFSVLPAHLYRFET